MLVERILEFMADSADGDFEELSSAAASAPETAADPRLRATAMARGVSPILPGPGRHPVLALAPEGAGASLLVDEILRGHGNDASLRAVRPTGVDPRATRSWLAARQRDGHAVVLAGTVSALDQLLSPLERRGLKFRLPPASSTVVVLEDADLATSDRDPGSELRDRLADALGLETPAMALAWAPARVASPFLAPFEEQPLFATPHWTRTRSDDEGRLVIVDLANLGSEIEVATGVPAIVEAIGFRLP